MNERKSENPLTQIPARESAYGVDWNYVPQIGGYLGLFVIEAFISARKRATSSRLNLRSPRFVIWNAFSLPSSLQRLTVLAWILATLVRLALDQDHY